MSYLAAILATACFAAVLRTAGILRVARQAIDTSRHAIGVLGDPRLSDEAKERAIRRGALALLTSFVSMLARTATAALAALLMLLSFDAAGLVAFASVTDALATWTGVAVGSVAMIVTFALRAR